MQTLPNTGTKIKRGLFIKAVLLVLATTKSWANSVSEMAANTSSNFKFIYTNSALKNNFFGFLKNVFHLFPEKELHNLIDTTTGKLGNDQQIYTEVQSKLHNISPVFSAFTYDLPTLHKQKDEMANETVQLIGEGGTYNGYLEIGSSGRFLDVLEEKMNIKGKRYYADGKEPGYGITEMVDRGQIFVGAEYIPMAAYHTIYSEHIPKESLDLVTVYVGFHHCPLELRTQYISSVRDILRPGGKLVLRDHDCHDEEQTRIVALAHDVFNMGTKQTWEYNTQEVRNFYSLDFIINYVTNLGFVFDKRTLFQEGDPTKNALMLFTKA